jgi:hypothetical protein
VFPIAETLGIDLNKIRLCFFPIHASGVGDKFPSQDIVGYADALLNGKSSKRSPRELRCDQRQQQTKQEQQKLCQPLFSYLHFDLELIVDWEFRSHNPGSTNNFLLHVGRRKVNRKQ